ncbi:AAA family ATPase [Streptomyces puniciscabiei]|uniref:AAA family ATPase n=1 Tax=Streptomyces puniciscabiei TaxID=164348 RepID=UPI0037AF4594
MGAPLEQSQLPLGPLTVLVGPNAAGKSNVLRVFQFLADVARVGILERARLGGLPGRVQPQPAARACGG